MSDYLDMVNGITMPVKDETEYAVYAWNETDEGGGSMLFAHRRDEVTARKELESKRDSGQYSYAHWAIARFDYVLNVTTSTVYRDDREEAKDGGPARQADRGVG